MRFDEENYMELASLKTKQDLKRIIVEELGYPAIGEQAFSLQVEEETKSKIGSATIIASHKGFNVVLVQFSSDSDRHQTNFDLKMRGLERTIISKVEKHLRSQYLFVFSSDSGDYWHFVNARSSGSRLELRRFSITPVNRKRLRTTQDRLALLRVSPSDTTQILIDKLRSAFDVEEVTMDFFRTFAEKFLELAEIIKKAHYLEYSRDRKKLLDVAQIILNRLIFLKFIEQKGWLDNNKDYLYDKFQPYFENRGSYWIEIINPLFDLLSNPARGKRYEQLGDTPFLNGGLFGAEPKDLFLISVPNSFFQDLFENLLNRFNFTIEESSPSSVEVAVDPEMLGRIFEELVLRMEKVMQKGEAELERELRRATGSYYTPRVAVFYMCREAIARRLASQTGLDINKVRELIDLAVDEFPDQKQTGKLSLSKTECQSLLRAAENISICDPAVGSGAFLLGSLQILVGIRRFLSLKIGEVETSRINLNYTLKEEIIKKNLIGVDILRQAVHLCELRLWLSLAVDYERKAGQPIPTLPNLTYKIFQGDSIVDHLADQPLEGFRYFRDFEASKAIIQKLNKIKTLKDRYFHETDESKKQKTQQEIAKERLMLAVDILEREAPAKISQSALFESGKFDSKKAMEKFHSDIRHDFIASLKRQLAVKKYDAHQDKLSFVWLVDLVEYFADHGRGGFDIVLGNPPYGVKNETMEKGKERYGLGSKDSYGVFMAMAFQDLLKVGGILSFITSDTWQTIKTHKPLRRFILDNVKVFNLVMMPPWLFGATVNTSILIATKSERGQRKQEEMGGGVTYDLAKLREQNELIACDFTRAEKNTNELDEYLYSLDEPKEISIPKKAIYKYKQSLIETNSNIPFFIGSPKLFALMNDMASKTIEKEIGEKEKKKVKVKQIELNGKIVDLIDLANIAEIKYGLRTGDNKKFLFKNHSGRGSYKIVDSNILINDEKVLLSVTDEERINGLNPVKYSGKYVVPLDKGGASDVDNNYLPNYFRTTDFFINWSVESVNKIKKIKGMRNPEFYFRKGISFSWTGQYSPTFRIGLGSVFDQSASCIFQNTFSYNLLLGMLCSKAQKFMLKNFIDHSVNTDITVISSCVITTGINTNKIEELVAKIIEKQKQNPRYDYMSNEQKEIDKLVYEMYGLNKDDIREVETWYARRYPKLARFCDIS